MKLLIRKSISLHCVCDAIIIFHVLCTKARYENIKFAECNRSDITYRHVKNSMCRTFKMDLKTKNISVDKG